MKRFSFESHTSEAAFKATGETLPELFVNAFDALVSVQVDASKVQRKQSVKIDLRATNVEELLHKLLERVLIEQDRKNIVLSQLEIDVLDEGDISLRAVAWGEKTSPSHELQTQVKAITWNQFSIKKLKKGYSCHVVVDV